jgi:AcrR family transcriptional regulator
MKKISPPAGTGRRRFDRDEALKIAMQLFWRHGYESTSMAELLKAMGLTAPSLYAAFGNKERLFLEAVEHYGSIYGTRLFQPLEEKIPARTAIGQMLRNAAAIVSGSKNPAGCLVTCGALNCSTESAHIEQALRQLRQANEQRIIDRLARAGKDGELPPSANPARLAKFFHVVMSGMQLQSLDGATKKELETVAQDAMAVWPPR